MTDLLKALYARNYKEATSLLQTPQGPTLANTWDEHGRLPLHVVFLSMKNGEGRAQLRVVVHLLLKHNPTSSLVNDNAGQLPIHYSMKVEEAAEFVKVLFDHDSKCLEVKNHDGLLPIHIAAKEGGACTLKLMLDLFPEGIKEKDKEGNLPLHLALKNNSISIPLLNILMESHPDSRVIRNSGGKLPIHIACEHPRSEEGRKNDHEEWNEFVQALAKLSPIGLRTRDNQRNLPIHFAVRWCNLETLKFFVQKTPISFVVGGDCGTLPLAFAIKHNTFAGDSNLAINFLIFLVDKYPSSLGQVDDEGNLPIHLAVSRSVLAVATTKFLISEYPQGLFVKNQRDKLPIDLCKGPKSGETAMLIAKACSVMGDLTDKNKKLEQDLKDQAKAFGDERKQLQIKLETQRKSFDEEKKQLKGAHKRELNEAQKLHEAAMNKQGGLFVARMARMEGFLKVYKDMASKSRKLEGKLRPKIGEGDSMEALKHFASSLKGRIDLLKDKLHPTSKRSFTQIFFDSVMSNPNLSSLELNECIESLDSELQGLEAELEKSLACGGDYSTNSGTAALIERSSSPVTSNQTGSPAKKSSVSP